MKKSSTGSKKGKNAKPKIIKITSEQLHQLTEAIRASNLDPFRIPSEGKFVLFIFLSINLGIM